MSIDKYDKDILDLPELIEEKQRKKQETEEQLAKLLDLEPIEKKQPEINYEKILDL